MSGPVHLNRGLDKLFKISSLCNFPMFHRTIANSLSNGHCFDDQKVKRTFKYFAPTD